MAKGFYVTVIRDDRKVGWLLGPYGSEPEARDHVGRARDKAVEIDGRNWFHAYGVTSIERDNGPKLPDGVLNRLIGLHPAGAQA